MGIKPRNSKPTIYLKPVNREFLESGEKGTLSGQINALIGRYARMVEITELPAFTEQEITLLTLVFEDNPMLADSATPHEIIRSLNTIATHPLTKKSDPSLPPLIQTLRQLTPGQVLTLRERIVRQR